MESKRFHFLVNYAFKSMKDKVSMSISLTPKSSYYFPQVFLYCAEHCMILQPVWLVQHFGFVVLEGKKQFSGKQNCLLGDAGWEFCDGNDYWGLLMLFNTHSWSSYSWHPWNSSFSMQATWTR